MDDLEELTKEGWYIQITYQPDGFYVDASGYGAVFSGFSEKSISEAIRKVVKEIPKHYRKLELP